MIGDCRGQHAAFDVAALADEVVGAVGVADPLDILMDDRPFIEVGGYIMRRRADHLDAARMGLVVGLGALEAGQEAVMDVDAAARQIGGKIVRQDLHVAGEDDQFRAGFLDHCLDLRFLARLRILGDGQVVIGNIADHRRVERRHRMVRDDADNVHRQLPDTVAVKKIAEAMVEFRHEQQHPPPLRRVAQAPVHRMIGSHAGESVAQLADVVPGLRQFSHDPHEEEAAFPIIELLRFKDIAAMRG